MRRGAISQQSVGHSKLLLYRDRVRAAPELIPAQTSHDRAFDVIPRGAAEILAISLPELQRKTARRVALHLVPTWQVSAIANRVAAHPSAASSSRGQILVTYRAPGLHIGCCFECGAATRSPTTPTQTRGARWSLLLAAG